MYVWMGGGGVGVDQVTFIDQNVAVMMRWQPKQQPSIPACI
jgi:hypothetical protein